MAESLEEEFGIRIELKIEYDFLTTTDVEVILSDVRVPFMKKLQKEGLAGIRDQFHIKKLGTGSAVMIILMIAELGLSGYALWEKFTDDNTSKKAEENIEKTTRRKNIEEIDYKVYVEEEVKRKRTIYQDK